MPKSPVKNEASEQTKRSGAINRYYNGIRECVFACCVLGTHDTLTNNPITDIEYLAEQEEICMRHFYLG